jgi:VCBS repeat-containing protein
VVSDGQGFFEQVVSATIGSVNDGPTVLGDAISVEEDGSFSGNVFSNDSDLDPGAVLSVSGLAAGEFRTLQGQFGTLKLFGDGSYTYAADRSNDLILGESGTDGFTYELSDGDGGTATGSFSAEVSGRDEDMVGNAGADVMTGERGADSLKGLDGPDLLRGHAGEDRLEGGGGDDTLDGGADGDRLEGGDGNDFCRRITSGTSSSRRPAGARTPSRRAGTSPWRTGSRSSRSSAWARRT